MAEDASQAAADLKDRAATAAADVTDHAQQAANQTRDELRQSRCRERRAPPGWGYLSDADSPFDPRAESRATDPGSVGRSPAPEHRRQIDVALDRDSARAVKLSDQKRS